jgi:hypothetical protein
MTSAIDIKRYRTRAQWRDMARATAHVRSFWKFFDFVNQFPRPARLKMVTRFEFAILEQGFCDNYIEPP